MNFIKKILLAFTLIMCTQVSVFANKGVAKAIILKGKVSAFNPTTNENVSLKKGSWVNEGFIVKTENKSFVKFLFIDKSQMNLGPESEMEISKFPKKKAGIITLMKGSLRSKVTKNYLDNKDKDKSRLFIKTKTAAMGVRGTDFMVTYNPVNENTALITFSGAVAMAQIADTVRNIQVTQSSLEKVVSGDTAVIVTKGQFSGVSPGKTSRATTPVKINPGQLESMKSNDGSKENSDQSSTGASKKKFRSVIPPGANSKGFSNKAKVADQVEKVIGKKITNAIVKKVDQDKVVTSAPPEGSVNKSTGQIAPPAGGYIDLATAQYIAPPAGSVFDAATETYIPPASFGGFNSETGHYENTNYSLTDDGKFVPTENLNRAPANVGAGTGTSTTGPLAEAPPKLASIDRPMESVNTENFSQDTHSSSIDAPDNGSIDVAGVDNADLDEIIQDVKNDINEAIEDAEDERNEVLNNSTRVKFNISNSN